MTRKKVSYRYQTMLLDNLQNEYIRMQEDDNNVGIAKKILVQMRYFMMHYEFEDEMVEKMSNLVDDVIYVINKMHAIERRECEQTTFITH